MKIYFTLPTATFKETAKVIDFFWRFYLFFIYQKPTRYRTRILDHLMVVVWRRRFQEEVTTYNATKTWASSNNFWVQLLCRRSPSGCFYGLIKGVSHKNTLRGLLLNIVTNKRDRRYEDSVWSKLCLLFIIWHIYFFSLLFLLKKTKV